MKKFVAYAIVAAFCMTVAGTALANTAYVKYEVDENDRSSRAGEGQNNNLESVPVNATLILDSVYMQLSTGTNAAGVARNAAFRGAPDIVPDLITPGPGQLLAWYGYWADLDADGVVDINATCANSVCVTGPKNEWGAKSNMTNGWFDEVGPTPDAKIWAFVHPGSHATADSNSQPADHQPDMEFFWSSAPTRPSEYNDRGYPMTFFDGSLLQTYRITTVANGKLAPIGAANPVICGTGCMTDIDVFATQAPAEVSTVYTAVADGTVNKLPPVNFALTNFGTGNIPDPAASKTGPVSDMLNPKYVIEYADPAGGYPADVGLDNYTAEYTAWIDMQARYVISTPAVGSYGGNFGFGPSGGQSSAPGFLGVTLNTGAWKDLNTDKFIGDLGSAQSNPHANDANPYWYGNVQDPNNYGDLTGEWLGLFPGGTGACEQDKYAYNVTVTPTAAGGWGPLGVTVWYSFLVDTVDTVENAPYLVTGTDPIKLTANCYTSDPALGLWFGNELIYFPAGNMGIPMKLETDDIPLVFGATSATHVVYDVDTLGGFIA